MAKKLIRGAFVMAAVIPAMTALALETDFAEGMSRLMTGVVSTIIYGLIGVALTLLGYKLFEWMMPFSVRHELEEDHNMSVGVVLAAMILGVSIIVAATIAS